MKKNKVGIIGVAPDGSLSQAARQKVEKAEIVFGGQRLLDFFPSVPAEKIAIGNNLADIAGRIGQDTGKKRIVVLASGDPGFHGIAAYLRNRLGKDRLEIIPNISSMQLAFAAIGESWDDAVLVSVHGRDIGEAMKDAHSADKIGILTSDTNTPARIAEALIAGHTGSFRAYVCQGLGTDGEKIVETDLPGLAGREFSPLNVLILIREETSVNPPVIAPGIPDEEFYRRKPKEGLITRQEVRAVSLSKLRLSGECVFWDIGAGSGSVSIEASFFVKSGKIYAIEKNPSDADIIRKNIEKFRTADIEVIEAYAPDELESLPDPDAVFIGGSGGKMREIIALVCRRLKPGGRIVANTIALENLNAALDALKSASLVPEITQVSVSRGAGILGLTRLEALNPVFIISAKSAGKG